MSPPKPFSSICYRATRSPIDVDVNKRDFEYAEQAEKHAIANWLSGGFEMVSVQEKSIDNYRKNPFLIFLRQRSKNYHPFRFGYLEEFFIGAPRFSDVFIEYYHYPIKAKKVELEIDKMVHHQASLRCGDSLASIVESLNGTGFAKFAYTIRAIGLEYLHLDGLTVVGGTARVHFTSKSVHEPP